MTHKKWSEKEIAFLVNHYNNYTNQEIANILDRTVGSIERKAGTLKLFKSQDTINNGKLRKKDLINFIKDNYENMTAQEIADIFNENVNNVRRIISYHGLQKSETCYGATSTRTVWTQEEEQFLNDNYQMLTQEQMSTVLHKTLKSIQKKMSYMGLKKKDRGITYTSKEVKFLIDNYNNYPLKELATLMNKTVSSIQYNARKHNLIKEIVPTRPEKDVMLILDRYNIPYDFQFNIRGFIADFRIGNKIIEVQGDYWHCNPKIYSEPINETQKNKIKIDKIKYNVYKELGYEVLYLWEYDIVNDINHCIEKILNFVAVLGQVSQETQDD